MVSSYASLVGSLASWKGCQLVRPLEGGFRNEVYLAERWGEYLVVKTTRRSEAALRWLIAVQERARDAGFVVPEVVLSDSGDLSVGGVIVETFIEGEPLLPADKPEVLRLIEAFHAKTVYKPQRPGFAAAKDLLTETFGGDVDLRQMPPALVQSCREAWKRLPDTSPVAVHGDLNLTNLLRTPAGQLALLDWDEARVDVPFFDTAVLAKTPLSSNETKILTAWEVAVSWQLEPEHARQQAQKLLDEDRNEPRNAHL